MQQLCLLSEFLTFPHFLICRHWHGYTDSQLVHLYWLLNTLCDNKLGTLNKTKTPHILRKYSFLVSSHRLGACPITWFDPCQNLKSEKSKDQHIKHFFFFLKASVGNQNWDLCQCRECTINSHVLLIGRKAWWDPSPWLSHHQKTKKLWKGPWM